MIRPRDIARRVADRVNAGLIGPGLAGRIVQTSAGLRVEVYSRERREVPPNVIRLGWHGAKLVVLSPYEPAVLSRLLYVE